MDAALTAKYRAAGWWPGERLVDLFAGHVEADPHRLSVRDDRGRSLTRRELWLESGIFVDLLADSGVRPRDTVLVLIPNRVEWQVVLLAILRLGAVPATIPMTTDATALTHVARLIGARALVTVAQHRRVRTDELAVTVMAAVAHRLDVFVLEDHQPRVVTGSGDLAGPAPDAVNHVMFTSSTTGMPKAVMHTEDTMAAVNIGFERRFDITQDTPLFMPSPLGHSVGAWHGGRLSLHSGAPLILQDRWDPETALRTVADEACVFTAAATPFLKDLVDVAWTAPEPKFATLRTFLCGGAPVPPHLMEQAGTELPHTFVSVLWGMTEGGVTTSVPGDDPAVTARTAGLPLPDLELGIRVPESDEVAEEGELVMRGPGVFTGYLGQPDLYLSSLTADGYFRTGDLARLGPDGRLTLVGRLKDLIVRGGVNLSPTPIEEAISAHPGVRQVAVIGTPDERIGERICAVVTLAPDVTLTLDELNAWLTAGGLSKRLLPERLECVTDMPVTAAGKIRKLQLRDRILHDTTDVPNQED